MSALGGEFNRSTQHLLTCEIGGARTRTLALDNVAHPHRNSPPEYRPGRDKGVELALLAAGIGARRQSTKKDLYLISACAAQTLKARIGRWNPLRVNSPTGSMLIVSPIVATTLLSIRICPSFAS